jgi:hypothetical protein
MPHIPLQDASGDIQRRETKQTEKSRLNPQRGATWPHLTSNIFLVRTVVPAVSL